MFASIASRYDLLNHLLSGNIDRRWRRLVAKNLRVPLANSEAQILDVACGTGDLALTLKENGSARIFGIDFCRPMLAIAVTKASKANWALPFVEGDALSLPFPDRSFEAATIAFGLRNLANFQAGIEELLRVLKPGGSFHFVDFIVDDASDGFFDRLFRSHAQMRDNTDERIRHLLSHTGFRNPVKVKERNMLFGLLRTAYYQAGDIQFA